MPRTGLGVPTEDLARQLVRDCEPQLTLGILSSGAIGIWGLSTSKVQGGNRPICAWATDTTRLVEVLPVVATFLNRHSYDLHDSTWEALGRLVDEEVEVPEPFVEFENEKLIINPNLVVGCTEYGGVGVYGLGGLNKHFVLWPSQWIRLVEAGPTLTTFVAECAPKSIVEIHEHIRSCARWISVRTTATAETTCPDCGGVTLQLDVPYCGWCRKEFKAAPIQPKRRSREGGIPMIPKDLDSPRARAPRTRRKNSEKS